MNRLKIHVITFTFLRYANFSKLMRTIHTSMASTFQWEYWHCFIFERCNKLHNETYQSWRYAWWALIWKKLAWRQNNECCKAGIHPKRLFFAVSFFFFFIWNLLIFFLVNITPSAIYVCFSDCLLVFVCFFFSYRRILSEVIVYIFATYCLLL